MSPRIACLVALSGLVALTCFALPAAVEAAPLDRYWPFPRHDVRRSNFSPTPSQIEAPVVRWRSFLGGSVGDVVAVDVDFDGNQDVIAIEGGRAVARRTDGGVLWATGPIGAYGIVGLVHVMGDSLPEVIVRGPVAAHVISLTTGATLWSTPAGLYPLLHIVSAADFDGDGVKDLAVADVGGGGGQAFGTTSIWRLKGNAPLLLGKTPIPSPDILTPGSFGQRSIDVDGDGLSDLMLAGNRHLYAFSGKTGAWMAASVELETLERAVLTMRSLPAKGGGSPLVVYAADTGSSAPGYNYRGVMAVRREGAVLKVLWEAKAKDFALDRFRSLPAGIGDLDGDGVSEILSNRFDGGQWRLQVRDAETGAVLGGESSVGGSPGAEGPYLTAVFRLGEGGPVALATVAAKSVDPPLMGELHLLGWTRKAGFTSLAALGKGVLSLANLPRIHDDDAAQVPLRAVQSLGGDLPGAGHVLVLRDLDGDSRSDALDLVRVSHGGAVQLQASRVFPLLPGPLGLVDTQEGRHLLVTLSDGQAQTLDADLKLRNDADANGVADLTYGAASNPLIIVAPVQDADPQPLVLIQNAGALVALDLTGAGPLQAPKPLWSFRSGPLQTPLGHLVDLDGDGTREVAVRHWPFQGTATLSVLEAKKGGPLWTYVHPGGPWAWSQTMLGDPFAAFDVQGDGAEDLMLQYYLPVAPPGPLPPALTVLDGKTHKPLWPDGAPCNQISLCGGAVDASVQPPRLVFSVWHLRFACNALDGAIHATAKGKTILYGVPMLADVDDDGVMDQVLAGAVEGMAAERTTDFQPLWNHATNALVNAPATLYPDGKAWRTATVVMGVPGVEVRDAKTGSLVWARRYLDGKAFTPETAPANPYVAGGLVASADLTGKGHPTLLLRTSQGWLYAVNAQDGSIDWAINWGGSFGDPILADVDGDGAVEILVTFSDGHLYALGKSVLGQVDWVRENAGKGPALSPEADVDTQEDAETLHVNWAPMAKAEGYAVQITDETGAIIVPQLPVGAKTAASLADLHLQPGLKYTAAVFGYVSKGKDTTWSQAQLSDGVTVVDASAPWIEGARFDEAAVASGGTSILRARLRDKTRVTRWQARLHADGQVDPALLLHDEPAGKATVDVALPFLAVDAKGAALSAGLVQAVLTVFDSAGHEATVTVTLRVCAPGEVAKGAVCGLPGPPPAGPKGTPGYNVERTDDSCRAGRSAGGGGLSLLMVGLLVGLLVAARRQRGRRRAVRVEVQRQDDRCQATNHSCRPPFP